eukprot:jgi/Galph1/5550/GphlegSOOS_G4138.1
MNESYRNFVAELDFGPDIRFYDETSVDAEIVSSESSENSQVERDSHHTASRLIIRLMNQNRERLSTQEEEEETDNADLLPGELLISASSQPHDQTISNEAVHVMQEEDDENHQTCPYLEFLISEDGPEDSRTHRLILSRFGLTGLILYRKLFILGPFCPRSPARLLVQLAGYFLWFKDNSALALRVNSDQDFLRRLLAVDEREVARLCDHMKLRDPMKLLIERLPPFALIKQAIREQDHFFKMALVLKFTLDIYDHYYSREVPVFETYRKKVLPLLVMFYGNVSQSTLDNVCYQQSKVLERMKWVIDWSTFDNNFCEDRDFLKGEFLFLPSREDYLEHYRNISRKIRNLTESLSSSSLVL